MKNNNFQTIGALTVRNMKTFLRDKMTFFLAMLSPLIVLLLFIMFLKNVQVDAINAGLLGMGISLDSVYVNGLVNGWFLSGVLGLSAITVAITTFATMVDDRENNILFDFVSSPIKNNTIKISYFISSLLITLIIMITIFAIGLFYLLVSGTFFLTFVDCLLILVNIILASMSSTIVMMLITSLFKKQSQLGGFTGIMSAVIGFLIGAYMPTSMMPKYFLYISNILPGSYATSIFRNHYISAIIEKSSSQIGEGGAEFLRTYFSANMDFFGTSIGMGTMYLILGLSIVVFGIVALLVFRKNKKIVK